MEDACTILQQPVSIYVHLPWCLHKCAYCDFNSHATEPNNFPEQEYTNQLITDLTRAAPLLNQRQVQSIFIGGGTPSLFSPESIAKILSACKHHTQVSKQCEVTLETNPSTFELQKFSAFLSAGVNRISIGAQSFNNKYLTALGRIHDASEAISAIETAHKIGFKNINVDLMFGLPEQTLADAIADVKTASQQLVNHISYYQLTLEPNTIFHRFPPKLPNDEISWDMQTTGIDLLADAGYQRYEVSAYAQPNSACAHNTNYWKYGDYLGIGAGAHSKITTHDGILRNRRSRQPTSYMQAVASDSHVLQQHTVTHAELIFEFMLNNLRLVDGFSAKSFTMTTGLSWSLIENQVLKYQQQGLIDQNGDRFCASELGYRFLDELTEKFLP